MSQCIRPVGSGENPAVVYIENAGTKIGVLTEVGGRLVFLSRDGSGNILKSDSTRWEEPDSLRPVINAETGWTEYNGHIVWLGPQNEWWIHQDLNSERKAKKAVWPPDPWLVFAPYELVERDSISVTLRSPESPVSGVQLLKSYRICDNGEAELEVTMTNKRNEAVSWDIWMNTRVDGYSDVYVPVEGPSAIRVKPGVSETHDSVRYEVRNGFFRYIPEPPPAGKSGRNSKAFILPAEPYMAAFTGDHCLVIGFERYDPGLTHPEQGMIEIYNATTQRRAEALTEMEFHGPYTTLGPGDSTRVKETWKINRYEGAEEDREAFLRSVIQPSP